MDKARTKCGPRSASKNHRKTRQTLLLWFHITQNGAHPPRWLHKRDTASCPERASGKMCAQHKPATRPCRSVSKHLFGKHVGYWSPDPIPLKNRGPLARLHRSHHEPLNLLRELAGAIEEVDSVVSRWWCPETQCRSEIRLVQVVAVKVSGGTECLRVLVDGQASSNSQAPRKP